jgi:hypothetical protein
MVIVVLATDAPGVMDVGAKAQVAYWGRPEQLNCTGALNPPMGVSEMVAVPDWPWAMVRLVPLDERLNVLVAATRSTV